MTMELIVVLAMGRAPTIDAWQRALHSRNIPVEFVQHVDLKTHSGFLPTRTSGQNSGFEFSEDSFREIAGLYPAIANVKLKHPVVFTFEWGGDFTECMSVFYTAEVLVSGFGGIAYDPQVDAAMDSSALSKMATACKSMAGIR